MKTPIGFHELCSGLHQDAMSLAGGDIERLGADCTLFVREAHQAELRAYLASVLDELSLTEMKGPIKREKTEIEIRRPKAAEAFLRAALKALSGSAPSP